MRRFRRWSDPGPLICVLGAVVLFLSAVLVTHASAQEGTIDTLPPVLENGTPAPGAGGPAVLAPPPLFGGAGPVSDGTENGSGREQDASRRSPASVERAAPPAAGMPGRQSPPAAVPATSSRPVKVLVEPAVLSRFECPRDAIARMLASSVTPGELSAALGLEREVLVLCRDRQGVLKEIVESEAQLAEVLRKDRAAREEEAAQAEQARRLRVVEMAGAARVLELAERSALEAAAKARAEAVKRPAPPPPPKFGWYTIIGRGEDLRAGVTDGETRRFVRAGDRLPGGVVVREIEVSPPGVRVSGVEAGRLPYRGLGGG